MRILCAIGQSDGPQIIQRLANMLGNQHEIYLLHVLDPGPRLGLEEYLHNPGPVQRRRALPLEKTQALDAAEQSASQAVLAEAIEAAQSAGFSVSGEIQRGKPEQMIVQTARTWRSQLIAIRASEGTQGRPQIGPASVGHTARFVLDHAPCDVLLLRGP
ncbi:MAG: universal stress protein [Anaerolineaceae bacterium]|jgi:nucleotide-binding universal stress UspA family protein